MTIIGKVAGELLSAGSSLAEAEGAGRLKNALDRAGFFVGAADAFADEHPVEAAAALVAGVAATTIFFPEAIAVSAEALADTDFMASIATKIGEYYGDEAYGKLAVLGASHFLADTTATSLAESGTKAAFKLGNLLLNQMNEGGLSPAPTFREVDTNQGTSKLSLVLADGQSFSTTYNGPNGTMGPILRDIENANGTSLITNFNPDGSATTALYSEPEGGGQVLRGSTTGLEHSGFSGQTVSITDYAPQISASDVTLQGAAVVGNQIEFPDTNQYLTGYTPPNSGTDVGRRVNIGRSFIDVDYPSELEGTNFLTAPFNGTVYSLPNSDGPTITGATVLSTNITGLTDANLAFTPKSVSVNVSGLSLPSDAPGYYDIGVSLGANTPSPHHLLKLHHI